MKIKYLFLLGFSFSFLNCWAQNPRTELCDSVYVIEFTTEDAEAISITERYTSWFEESLVSLTKSRDDLRVCHIISRDDLDVLQKQRINELRIQNKSDNEIAEYLRTNTYFKGNVIVLGEVERDLDNLEVSIAFKNINTSELLHSGSFNISTKKATKREVVLTKMDALLLRLFYSGFTKPIKRITPIDGYKNQIGITKKEGKFIVIDQSGNNQKANFDPPKNGVIKFKLVDQNKYGVINSEGKWVLNPEYNEITIEQRYFITEKQKKYDFFSKKGELLHGGYSSVKQISNEIFMVKKDGKSSKINFKGAVMLNVYTNYKRKGPVINGMITFEGKNGKFGFMNNKEQLKVGAKFIKVGIFGKKIRLAPVQIENQKWMYINTSGESVFNYQYYDWAGNFYENYAPIEYNGQFKFINHQGKETVRYFEYANVTSEGKLLVIKKKGQEVIEIQPTDLVFK